jgi:hypothetical protein
MGSSHSGAHSRLAAQDSIIFQNADGQPVPDNLVRLVTIKPTKSSKKSANSAMGSHRRSRLATALQLCMTLGAFENGLLCPHG